MSDYQPKPVVEPLSMTFEEAIAEAHKHEWRIHFHHDGFVEIETFSGDDLAYEEGLLPALSYALGVPVVARDEASDLKALKAAIRKYVEADREAHADRYTSRWLNATRRRDAAWDEVLRLAGGEDQP